MVGFEAYPGAGRSKTCDGLDIQRVRESSEKGLVKRSRKRRNDTSTKRGNYKQNKDQ